MWRLVTSAVIATERIWRSTYKAKVLLMTFCLWFVVEVAEVAADSTDIIGIVQA